MPPIRPHRHPYCLVHFLPPIRWGICEQPVTPVVEGHGLIKRAEGMASGRKDYERAGEKIYFPSARLGGVGQLGFIAHFFGLRLFRAT